jgi:zinc and cadmium transporter
MISAAAEAVHNALDGALIASSYLVDFRAGMLATAAVAFHEIPHELGNVAVLLHAGYSPRRAVLINLASAAAAVFGAIAVLSLGDRVRGLTVYAAPVAAGGFLYLALGILAPDLWRTSSRGQKSAQSLGAAIGFVLTAVVAWWR